MQPLANMALRAARKAGQIIVRAVDRVDRVNAEQKGKNDWVSDIDRAAEAAIIETLLTAYPDHGFLGEESGHREGHDGHTTWIIDPLDGTTNFLRGIPPFRDLHRLPAARTSRTCGGLRPLRDEAFVASRGYGAQLNGKRLRVTAFRASTVPSSARAFPIGKKLPIFSLTWGWPGRHAGGCGSSSCRFRSP